MTKEELKVLIENIDIVMPIIKASKIRLINHENNNGVEFELFGQDIANLKDAVTGDEEKV
jgi:hypothetical protein